jgi:hypothetical protein
MTDDRPWPLGYRRATQGDLLITKTQRDGVMGFMPAWEAEATLCMSIPAGTEVLITNLPEDFCDAHRLTGTEHPALFRIDEGDVTHECVRFYETVKDVPLNDFPEEVYFKIVKILECMGG